MVKEKNEKTKKQDHVFISEHELRSRETKYFSRLSSIKICQKILNEAIATTLTNDRDKEVIQQWQHYVDCNKLPKPYNIGEIREIFARLRFFEERNVEETINWLLKTDERSILISDLKRIDVSFKSIKAQQRNFGDLYQESIDLLLKIYKRIENYLDDDNNLFGVDIEFLDNVLKAKCDVQNEIKDLLDLYTYRIISTEVPYMQYVDPRTADYFYNCTNFQIHIWTITNVPIRFQYMIPPVMEANLHALSLHIDIPNSILEENLTLRGLHLNFDHLSEHAKSYAQQVPLIPGNSNVGSIDLYSCLVNEWAMQMSIMADVLEKYNLKQLENEEKRIKDKKTGGGQTTVLKYSKRMNPDTYPDIWHDFLRMEQEGFDSFINSVYHPDHLKLKEYEVNLKKYCMAGGIYQIEFVKKPKQYQFNKWTTTAHVNNRKLDFQKKKVHVAIEKFNILSTINVSVRHVSHMEATLSARHSMLPEYINQSADDSLLSEFFCLTFQLPQCLCLWGEPIICHYETNVNDIIETVAEVPPEPVKHSTKHKHTDEKIPDRSARLSYYATIPSEPTKYSTKRIPSDTSSRQSFFTNMPLQYSVSKKLYRPSLFTALSNRRISSPAKQEYVEDFNLNYPLTINDIFQIKHHCLSRMISSYNFIQEATDGDGEYKNLDPKNLKLENQNNPERLFPLFARTNHLFRSTLPPIDFSREIENDVSSSKPETFSELINVLDMLKYLYLYDIRKTVETPHFEPKVRTSMKSQTSDTQLPRTKRNIKSSGTPVSTLKTLKIKKSAKYDLYEDDILEKRYSVDPKKKNPLTAEELPKTWTYSRWTKKYILKSVFDRETCKLSIWTDRLGIIGFACKRYEHFPFRFWSVMPSEENPTSEVVINIMTTHVKCVLFVTSDGYKGYVSQPTVKYTSKPIMYLEIEEPLNDIKDLKKRFESVNVNIFSNHDARFYIENGYFSEKHVAVEFHTYSCMAINCGVMHCQYSEWNRLATRRDIVMYAGPHKDNMHLIHITPEESTFVEVQEQCTDNVDIFSLKYTLTWRNIDFYADLHSLLMSLHSEGFTGCHEPRLACNLKNILCEIRPLSFS